MLHLARTAVTEYHKRITIAHRAQQFTRITYSFTGTRSLSINEITISTICCKLYVNFFGLMQCKWTRKTTIWSIGFHGWRVSSRVKIISNKCLPFLMCFSWLSIQSSSSLISRVHFKRAFCSRIAFFWIKSALIFRVVLLPLLYALKVRWWIHEFFVFIFSARYALYRLNKNIFSFISILAKISTSIYLCPTVSVTRISQNHIVESKPSSITHYYSGNHKNKKFKSIVHRQQLRNQQFIKSFHILCCRPYDPHQSRTRSGYFHIFFSFHVSEIGVFVKWEIIVLFSRQRILHSNVVSDFVLLYFSVYFCL